MGSHHSKEHHSTPVSSARQVQGVQRASRGDSEPILQEGTRIDLLGPSNTASSEEETIILTQGDLLGNTENSKEEATTVEQADPEVSFGTAAPGVSRRMSMMSETERLCDARSADDEKLSRLFPPDRYATYEMGDIDDFVGGLGAMVGPPNPDLMTTMTDEHTMRYDSSAEFSNAPYWIRTTSEIEWFFVTDPEGGLAKLGLSEWPAEGDNAVEKCTVSDWMHVLLPSDRRKPLPLSAFRHRLERHNQVLRKYSLAPIMHEELIGGRLYSGPLAVKYQAVLEAVDSRDPAKHRRYIELCSDQKTLEAYLAAAATDPMAAWASARVNCTNYSTTLHVIKSVLLRLGKLMTACKLYRGLNGMAPPPSFLAERFHVRGGIEPGFLTASRNRQKAVDWAQSVKGGTTPEGSEVFGLLFEIDQGLVDRGADITWFSQYPREDEIIFPPHTALQVTAVRDEGKIIVFECRVTVNSNDMPMDMVVTQRLSGLVCIATSLKFGLQRELPDHLKRKAAQEYHSIVFGSGAADQPGLLKLTEPRRYNEPEAFSDALRMLSDSTCHVVRKHKEFTFRFRRLPGGPLEPLAPFVREYSIVERSAILARQGSVTKYTDAKLTTGRPKEAALGIHKYLGMDERLLWTGMGRGLAAIEEEIRAHGTEDDIECLEYVLHGTAGMHPREWQHSGGKKMDQFYEGVTGDQRLGKSLDYFVQHEQAREATLLVEHVVALRLYTTAAYKSINDPLRGRGQYGDGPHPFPVTVCYITDGIKKLRAVGASLPDANTQRDFWRGMRNIELPDGFRQTGGTEFAPLSTSSELKVALNYSDGAETRLLFKLTTNSFLERGADLQFLSAFPGEVEFLYPPLTFLDPTGNEEVIETECGVKFTIVEVQPRI